MERRSPTARLRTSAVQATHRAPTPRAPKPPAAPAEQAKLAAAPAQGADRLRAGAGTRRRLRRRLLDVGRQAARRNIPRVEIGHRHPAEQKDHHEEKYPLNILLLGADHGQVGQSVAEDLEDGKWTPGQHLSDTIMVLHIPADRKSVQLVSIPRDTWVTIDGYPADGGHGKINAAFSYGGPELAYKTVEQLTGLKIDHVAIIDWVGFRDLTTRTRRRPGLHA